MIARSNSPQCGNIKVGPEQSRLLPLALLRDLRTGHLAFLDRLRSVGDVVPFRFFGGRLVFVFHPEVARHVLQDNSHNYQKETLSVRAIKDLAGEGLLNCDGDLWLKQRREAQPAFHRKSVATMVESMTITISAMLDRWMSKALSAETIEVSNEMLQLAVNSFLCCMLSAKFEGQIGEFGSLLEQGFEYIQHRTYHVFSAPKFWPTRFNRGFFHARRELRAIATRIIDSWASGCDPGPLGRLLAEANVDRRIIRDQIITFLATGSETVSVTMSWCLHLLSSYPRIAELVEEEVRSQIGQRKPRAEDLPNLVHTRMVVNETLRLYPPAFVVARTSIGPDKLGGYSLPSASAVIISVYNIQRDARFWHEPDRFYPTRFDLGKHIDERAYTFFPFGGGPRRCIGAEFAMTEMILILAMVAQRFKIGRRTGEMPRPSPLFTLRPQPPIALKLQPIGTCGRSGFR